jgi:hypothetical protein
MTESSIIALAEGSKRTRRVRFCTGPENQRASGAISLRSTTGASRAADAGGNRSTSADASDFPRVSKCMFLEPERGVIGVSRGDCSTSFDVPDLQRESKCMFLEPERGVTGMIIMIDKEYNIAYNLGVMICSSIDLSIFRQFPESPAWWVDCDLKERSHGSTRHSESSGTKLRRWGSHAITYSRRIRALCSHTRQHRNKPGYFESK